MLLEDLSLPQGQPLQNLVNVLGIQDKQGKEIFYLNPWPHETVHKVLHFSFLIAFAEKPPTEIPLNDLVLRLLRLAFGLLLRGLRGLALRQLCIAGVGRQANLGACCYS